MHIGIEGHGFWGEGGSQTRYAFQLIRALARIDRTNRYIVFFNSARRRLPGQGRFREQLQNDNFSYVMTRLPNTGSPWLKRLRRDVLWPWRGAQRGIGLFHSTAQRRMYTNGVASVLTIHDLAGLVHPEWFPSDSLAHEQNATALRDIRQARLTIASSRNTQQDIQRMAGVGLERVRVVLLGVDTGEFHPVEDPAAIEAVTRRLGIRGPYLLHVGDLVPRKNLERLIRVFARLKASKRLPHQLVLAGKRNYGPPSLFELPRALGVGDDVLFPGFVEEANLPALYAGAALFVYPSCYEGFGLPLLEAMACGVPVISSNAASLVEVAGEAAIILDPSDEAGWEETIGDLLDDDATRRALIARGLAHVQGFTWDKTAKQTLAAYRELGAD
ncbi:MAG: glycosyltransferase family 4 protein [Candidatus Omnitrophica bacterium]|nr:glycosyltransferase family 4 protein [Candidatus Omnitrophota bacterium]